MSDRQSPTNPHFFQPLLPNFHSHLNIPKKFFSVYMESKHQVNTVELRSEASDKTWKVKIERQRLTIGWKEFALAYDLRIGDIIVFKHDGELVFHVTCHGPSCCEIQYIQHSSSNTAEDDQNNIRNLSTKSEEDSCFVAHVTYSNLREDTLNFPRKLTISNIIDKGSNMIYLMDQREKTWTLTLKFRNSSLTFYIRGGWRMFCHENRFKPGDFIAFKLERSNNNNRNTPLLRFSTSESTKSVSTKHCRRTGETSHMMSSSSLVNRYVTLNVTPASLKRGRLYLPQSFSEGSEMEAAKRLTLLDKNGLEWPVNIVRQRRYTRLQLGSGLRPFLEAIEVKAYESFVLELIRNETPSTPHKLKFCFKFKTSMALF